MKCILWCQPISLKDPKSLEQSQKNGKNGYYLEFQTQAEDRTRISLDFSGEVSRVSSWPIKWEDFRLLKYSYREVLKGRV